MMCGPGSACGQRLLQSVAHFGDIVGVVDLANPLGADALHRINDVLLVVRFGVVRAG